MQHASGVCITEVCYIQIQVLKFHTLVLIYIIIMRTYFLIGLGKAQSLVWIEGDAESLSFKDESFDGYTIAFGIRNVTHIDKALKEAYRLENVYILCHFPFFSSCTRRQMLYFFL